MQRLAFHDSLTGLANRTLFLDRLEHAFQRHRRTQRKLALIYLDLDGFKLINDSLGHEAGDQLLIEVAGRIQQCVRTGDTVARMGGDEFTILFEGFTAQSQVERVAQRILQEVSFGFVIGGQDVSVTPSIGIAFGRSIQDASDLLRSADLAMYEAKRSGKACCRVFKQ